MRVSAAREAIAAGVPVDPERAERRHANGAWCIAAFADEALVGYRWLQLGSHRDEELRVTFVLEPPDRVAWLWNFYVDPHYRATRLFSYLWEETFALLRDLGAARTLSWIWAIQPGLVNAERRFGATIVGTASFFVVGPWQLMASSLSPRAHVSFGPKQEPRLVVGDATQNLR